MELCSYLESTSFIADRSFHQPPKVLEELEDLVKALASMYK